MTDDPTAPPDDLNPEQLLALIDIETRGVKRAFGVQVPIYYFLWAGAWLVGYLLLWASWPGSPTPVVVPPWVAVPVFAALVLAAAITSAVVGIRSNHGIKGVSDFVGTVYGISWAILGTVIAAIGYALIAAGANDEVIAIYFTSAYALLVAAMYLAGAMLWRSIDQLVIALVMAASAAGTGFFGAPGNLLAMALTAGPALVIGGVVAVLRFRRI